ncbi:protein Wnt-4-like [Dysidea avara]|uniref:protein Wnt-4-like n=1 Tax=Dysidea avara TaxID=196820 RepID=UPI00331E6242
MSGCTTILLLALLVVQFPSNYCSDWWSIVKERDHVFNQEDITSPISQHCSDPALFNGTLNACQLNICRRDTKLLSTIAIGILRALNQCQKLFKNRPWNCSVFDSGPYLGKFVERGTHETAFLNAIISAGIAREVARNCKEHKLESCACDLSEPSTPSPGIVSIRHCGDNSNYGINIAKEFTECVDADGCIGQAASHNSEVGRKLVSSTTVECSCFGICALKTCHKKVPEIEEIGIKLLAQYDAAKQIKENQLMNSSNLVYCNSSPNFCKRNLTEGMYGSSGRQCWPNRVGPSSCWEMCCGGPVEQRMATEIDTSQCYFEWSIKKINCATKTVTRQYCK